jgi:hypothetical protein
LYVTSIAPQRVNRLLSRKDAATFLTRLGFSIAPQTLARLYSEGRGPVCMHLGRRAVYKPADLVSYFRQQASAPNQSARAPRLPAANDDLPDAANGYDDEDEED